MNARRIVAFFLAGTAALVLLTGSVASAQTDSESNPEYRRVVGQALDEFQRGNWDEAYALFEQAHRIHPNARTLRGMGFASFEARRYVAALEHLRAALASRVNPLTPSQRSEAQAAIDRSEHYIATIEITVEPQAAEVRVDDKIVEPEGGQRVIRVDPGLVHVQATAPDYEPAQRELRLTAGAEEHVELELEPVRTAGEVTPITPAALTSSAAPAPAATSSGPQFGVWKWIALGAGAAAIGAGVVFHVQREHAAGLYNDDDACGEQNATPDQTKRCNGYRDDVSTDTALMAIGYGAGAALAITGVVMLVLEGKDPGDQARSGCDVGLAAAACRVRF